MKIFEFRGEQVTMYMAKYINGKRSLQIKDLMGFPLVRVSLYIPSSSLGENEICVDFTSISSDTLKFLLDRNILNKDSGRLEEYDHLFYLVITLNPDSMWRGWEDLSEQTLDDISLGIAV